MTARRVLLGPENPAGVASALREGLRERGHAADVVTFAPHPFGYVHDRVAPGYAARAREGLRAPLRYDVLHFQFGTTLLEFLDAAWAHVAGRPLLLMHYWGDDARTREITERLHPARARVFDAGVPRDDRTVRRRLRLAGRLCRAALVSDLELASQVSPYHRRVYVVPTPLGSLGTAGAEAAAQRDGGAPVVFHAPSSAAIKGTAEIVAAMERVGARAALRPRTVSGVPREAVLGEIAGADIVVDQLNSETPGVFALEAMALGKPVLLEYSSAALAPFARHAPLIRVTAETLEHELEALAADPMRRAEVGEAGRRFVTEVHAASRVAAAMEHVYAHAPAAPPGVYTATPAGIRALDA